MKKVPGNHSTSATVSIKHTWLVYRCYFMKSREILCTLKADQFNNRRRRRTPNPLLNRYNRVKHEHKMSGNNMRFSMTMYQWDGEDMYSRLLQDALNVTAILFKPINIEYKTKQSTKLDNKLKLDFNNLQVIITTGLKMKL